MSYTLHRYLSKESVQFWLYLMISMSFDFMGIILEGGIFNFYTLIVTQTLNTYLSY